MGKLIKLDFTGRTILVVEDDTISRLYLRELLTPTGALVDFVRNGKEALEYFNQNHVPYIVLMDIKLPDIDGITLSRTLIEKYPNIKIIAQTAYASNEVEKLCKEAGMKAFLTKPLRNENLMKVLGSLI